MTHNKIQYHFNHCKVKTLIDKTQKVIQEIDKTANEQINPFTASELKTPLGLILFDYLNMKIGKYNEKPKTLIDDQVKELLDYKKLNKK